MNDWCFRPRFWTVKVILGRKQPRQMRTELLILWLYYIMLKDKYLTAYRYKMTYLYCDSGVNRTHGNCCSFHPYLSFILLRQVWPLYKWVSAWGGIWQIYLHTHTHTPTPTRTHTSCLQMLRQDSDRIDRLICFLY